MSAANLIFAAGPIFLLIFLMTKLVVLATPIPQMVFVRLLMVGGDNSAVMILGQWLAGAPEAGGNTWPLTLERSARSSPDRTPSPI